MDILKIHKLVHNAYNVLKFYREIKKFRFAASMNL